LSSQVLEPSGKENDKEKSFVIYRERERERERERANLVAK
jgi:hypothetical protein